MQMSPILLHIPHSSWVIPEEHLPIFVVSETELQAELLRVTDSYTDELFELEKSERLVFPVSRLLVDPERFASDEEEVMAQKGLGAVYERTADGSILKAGFDRQALMHQYYEPHHRLLNEWCSSHEQCLIIDCHSYPSKPLPCDLSQDSDRPPFCIGTDGFHTPEWLSQAAQSFLAHSGYEAPINSPYAGTMVPSIAYQQNPDTLSIMVEVNRNLYMDEKTGEKLERFGEVKALISELLQFLAAEFEDRFDLSSH